MNSLDGSREFKSIYYQKSQNELVANAARSIRSRARSQVF